MTLYSDNFWAEEMGIDLDELQRESPLHPDQLQRANRKLTKQAAEYWARERFWHAFTVQHLRPHTHLLRKGQ
jgi:hypothetical protein